MEVPGAGTPGTSLFRAGGRARLWAHFILRSPRGRAVRRFSAAAVFGRAGAFLRASAAAGRLARRPLEPLVGAGRIFHCARCGATLTAGAAVFFYLISSRIRLQRAL